MKKHFYIGLIAFAVLVLALGGLVVRSTAAVVRRVKTSTSAASPSPGRRIAFRAWAAVLVPHRTSASLAESAPVDELGEDAGAGLCRWTAESMDERLAGIYSH